MRHFIEEIHAGINKVIIIMFSCFTSGLVATWHPSWQSRRREGRGNSGGFSFVRRTGGPRWPRWHRGAFGDHRLRPRRPLTSWSGAHRSHRCRSKRVLAAGLHTTPSRPAGVTAYHWHGHLQDLTFVTCTQPPTWSPIYTISYLPNLPSTRSQKSIPNTSALKDPWPSRCCAAFRRRPGAQRPIPPLSGAPFEVCW